MQMVLENQTHKAASSHSTDFDPPIYTIWKQQEKATGSSHFGNSEVRWLEKGCDDHPYKKLR